VTFHPPPATACWQHRGARSGFEVTYFQALEGGWRIEGTTAAIEDGQTWAVNYRIELDPGWATRSAHVTARTAAGSHETLLRSDGAGHWLVDGNPAPHLDGCGDVDLESSAMTNALPVHRLDLPVGVRTAAPAAYVRVLGLTVERLEQTYTRVRDETADDAAHRGFDYTAPAFGFSCRLAYDEGGLVLEYPGIAVRAG
jgi:uncharacterized protein